ncbi:hypothetical protein TVAG_110500 [Trichomonas vaginalis G3]|uniref:Uncharacterized protein n=1 Tax=Trichomonas vaginalis (strain ATCC PRA-98 / G3) TaxID=412133 RepID=A2DGQ1_TRIV3|nr:hypothetical protein TVAGG3_0997550 [Trichomonas vaginalis G3]EAY20438.1 hypothetical protein TVAG_110500 [Trichomonas vaginalis G3]KAI5490512.1 hypothetical protein TVAGG3_0997550 [Trichomonas vaginalis G3]|eukprot:XP_001581424.1 hypothetical protein [Trichomonas vaginalis G3]
MPIDSQELANQIILAIKNSGINVEKSSFQLSSMIFGFKIVEKIVERQKWSSEVSNINSGLFAELFTSYATVFGLPTSKNTSNKTIQIVNSCSAITLYYHLLLGSFQDLEQFIYDMNRLLSDYFTNKISEGEVNLANKKTLEFLQQMFNLNHFADIEISILPLECGLKRTYEKFKDILDATTKLCALCNTFCETVKKDLHQVKDLQIEYEKIYTQAFEIIQRLTKQYQDLRNTIISKFSPIFEHKEFNDFAEYLNKLLTILSTIAYVSILTAENKPDSFAMIQKVLDELLIRFNIITNKSINVMHFKGDLRITIEEIRKAYNDVELIVSPLQSALVAVIQQIPPPYNYISAKRLTKNFQELNGLLNSFNSRLKTVEDTIVKLIFQPKLSNDVSFDEDSIGSSQEYENSLTIPAQKPQTPNQYQKQPQIEAPLPENKTYIQPAQNQKQSPIQTPVENKIQIPPAQYERPPPIRTPEHENKIQIPPAQFQKQPQIQAPAENKMQTQPAQYEKQPQIQAPIENKIQIPPAQHEKKSQAQTPEREVQPINQPIQNQAKLQTHEHEQKPKPQTPVNENKVTELKPTEIKPKTPSPKPSPKEEPKKEEKFFEVTERLVLDLLDTEKAIDEVIKLFPKITQLCNFHLGQFTNLINNEKDEEMRALYINHRSNVYFSYSNFNHSVNILQASKDNSCFRKYVAVTSISLLLAQCTANYDPVVIVSLKKLLSILAVKNGVLFFQEKEMIVQILSHVIQHVPQNEAFSQYIIQLCMKIIIDCESKIPKSVNPDSPKTIIPCIEQNYNIGVALNAISAVLHHDEKTQPIVLLLEKYSFIFTHFPLYYRITAQLYIMQGTYEFSNTTKSIEFIFKQMEGKHDELIRKTQNSMKIIKSFIHNPPPAGTYDRQYINDLLEAVHNGYKDSIVFFHAAQEILEKSNDQVTEVKKDINHLAESLKEIIRLLLFITEITTSIKFEVPPIFSVIIKTDFLLIIQYFQMILSNFNQYSFLINEIISRLFSIAEYLQNYPSLKYLVDSIHANGDILEKCGIKASLKEHDTNYDLQFAIKNIEEIYEEICPICDEFAQEIFASEGKVEKAIELSEKSEFHIKKLLITRSIHDYSLSNSKRETIEESMSKNGIELIAELRDNSIDPSKVPDKYKGNDLSLAMQVGFRAKIGIESYKVRNELSQEQNNFVQERINESKSDDYHDAISGSLLSVISSSDLRAKVNRDFNNWISEYLIRKIIDASGEILEEQQNSSVIGVFLFQNSQKLAYLLGLRDEQFEFIFNSLQMHQIKGTPSERQFESERICSNGLTQNRIKPNQLAIIQNIVNAYDAQFDIDSFVATISNDELMGHNFLKDDFDEIKDIIIEMNMKSESAESYIKYEDQKTYVGNKIFELNAHQQNLIRALTPLNKQMIYSKLTRLPEFGLPQIKMNEIDRIIESISVEIAKEQARISTHANCDFESHGIGKEIRTNIAIDILMSRPKQLTPPEPVQQTNNLDEDSIPPVIQPEEQEHKDIPPYVPPKNIPPYVPPKNIPPYVPPKNIPPYVPPKNIPPYVPPKNIPPYVPPKNIPPYVPPKNIPPYVPPKNIPPYVPPKNIPPNPPHQDIPKYIPPQNTV